MKTAQPPAEVREVANHLVESLGDNLGALLWHGSKARGEARPDSDHDLIVVLKQIDDDALLRLRDVFQGRENWSSFVQSEEELRQFPADGRFQLHFGFKVLHGDFEPPPWTRENIIADLRALARNIRFECRYRLLHAEPEFSEMDEHYRGFLRARNARMLYYAAKLAVLALKSRAALQGSAYPVTHRELRAALADPEDIAVLDLIESWPQPRETHPDVTSVALQLDAFARRLIRQLPVGEKHA